LRALRAQAGLAGKDLAATTSWQPSKVSRIENGRQLPTVEDLSQWTEACEVEPATFQELVNLLHEAEAVHLDWKRRMRRGQVAVQTNYSQLVQESELIRHFETVYIPGLLQTHEYARRVLTEMVDLHGIDPSDVEDAVSVRLQRQQLLYHPGKRFEFLVTEAVLRFLLTSAEVMRGQLDRLQTVINTPNIRFGVVPFGVPLKTTPQNSFQMYDDVAIVETILGETTYTG